MFLFNKLKKRQASNGAESSDDGAPSGWDPPSASKRGAPGAKARHLKKQKIKAHTRTHSRTRRTHEPYITLLLQLDIKMAARMHARMHVFFPLDFAPNVNLGCASLEGLFSHV